MSILADVASCHADLLFRFDAGLGTDQYINWMLTQNFQILGKMYSQTRVRKLARSVTHWQPTLSSPGREMGTLPHPRRFARRTTQLAVRTPKKHPEGTWAYGILVTTLHHLSVEDLVTSMMIEVEALKANSGVIGKAWGLPQGASTAWRLNTSCSAWQNAPIISWSGPAAVSVLNQLGMRRLVRDLFQVSGYLLLHQATIVEIGLNRRHPYAYALRDSLNRLLNGMPHITLWDPVECLKEQEQVWLITLDH